MWISVFFVLSILAGQLVKFPLFTIQGPTLLDIFVILISLIGTFKIKFKLRKPTLVIKSGLLFCLIAILSLIFTPLHLSKSEYIISFSYTLRFFIYLYFGWVIYSNAFNKFKEQISKTLLISGVGLAILGLVQFIFLPNLQFLQPLGWDPHYFRTVSTFLDPNFTGAYFVLTFFLLFSLRARRAWQLFLFSIVYIALLTTFSRSSYLMFLISGLIYATLQKSRKLGIIIIVLFLGLLLGFQIYSQLIAKPRGINREQSAAFRLDTWQQGLDLFNKSPILGVGFNTYKYALREYHLSDLGFLDTRGATTNDSSLLYVLATTGVLGFLTYLMFLFSLTKTGMKNNIILSAAIGGLIFHSLFANSLFYPFILVWIFLKVADTKI